MACYSSIIAFAVIVSAFAIPANAIPTPKAQSNCASELSNAGASKAFHMTVAHVVHSMSLGNLKMFDPEATEDNFVPTINFDLLAEMAILPYAPDRRTNDTDSFMTTGMKVLDSVLTHMDEKHWDMVSFDPLERLVHAFHMQEMWAHVKMEFDKFGKGVAAPSAKACECAMDIDNNGIMQYMRFVAMILREPYLFYGDPRFSDRNLMQNQRNEPAKNEIFG